MVMVMLADWSNGHQQDMLEYLKAENKRECPIDS